MRGKRAKRIRRHSETFMMGSGYRQHEISGEIRVQGPRAIYQAIKRAAHGRQDIEAIVWDDLQLVGDGYGWFKVKFPRILTPFIPPRIRKALAS